MQIIETVQIIEFYDKIAFWKISAVEARAKLADFGYVGCSRWQKVSDMRDRSSKRTFQAVIRLLTSVQEGKLAFLTRSRSCFFFIDLLGSNLVVEFFLTRSTRYFGDLDALLEIRMER